MKVWVQRGRDIVQIDARKGDNMLKILKSAKVDILSSCNGKGFCGKCKVRVLDGKGNINDITLTEIDHLSSVERASGYRLACCVEVEGDIKIEIPGINGRDAKILVSGAEVKGILNPIVKKTFAHLPRPTVSDQRSDMTRVMEGINSNSPVGLDILQHLPKTLRDNDFKVTITSIEDNVVSVEGGNTGKIMYGVAVDIGTTTVVGYLIDLATGMQVDVYSALNAQKAYGDDVISRTDFTVENPDGLSVMKDLTVSQINDMMDYFWRKNDIDRNHIYQMVVVGNTIMVHLLLGLPVEHIAVSPFVPVISQRYRIKAKDLGISINKGGYIYILPCVAGYIGADTIGAILASGMAENEEISLLVDIGTNGEIALGNKDGILACSTAAGPAFEGAHIRHGLGGVKGAINKIVIDGDVKYTTIGGTSPRGICGSGIVDGISQMLLSKVLEPYGRIRDKEDLKKINQKLAERIIDIDGEPAFKLAEDERGRDIAICQRDIREVQLAKGAICAGIQILLKESGVTHDRVDRVYLAGGFGNYIDYNNACNIGLIPKQFTDKILPIGNGAGAGAKMALLSEEYMDGATKIHNMIEYIELSTRPDFQEVFVDCLAF
ncbi:MAG TPA: DUF4445 domain-containing protein [Clostridiales bacterium]|nr:DUF4445 domain-containing protein [Clostridiales bacterium]